MARRIKLDRLGQQLLRRHIGSGSSNDDGGGDAEEPDALLLVSLHRQLAKAKAENEQEITCVLASQIAELSQPPQLHSIYHIRLASSHYHSIASSYLDAQRTCRRDMLDEHT